MAKNKSQDGAQRKRNRGGSGAAAVGTQEIQQDEQHKSCGDDAADQGQVS